MKRRDFLKCLGTATVAAAVMPTALMAAGKGEAKFPPAPYNWQYMGGDKKPDLQRFKQVSYDVAVIGAGMAGIGAAVAAARQGAKVVLISDRPVLGGNASSECRITVNGARGLKDRERGSLERETGIIEEILLENKLYNMQDSYPVWDHILYNFVYSEPNIKIMMNTKALEAVMKGKRISAVRALQLTTETEFLISAKQFIDCSGDGQVAASAGAEFRVGREGREEFGEDLAPAQPDGWVMGDTIMMISKDMGREIPFKAPDYAIPFNPNMNKRSVDKFKEGFWWVELGSDVDIIGQADDIRHNLMAHFYGVWDYIKNSGKYPSAKNYALEWVGSYPGRRESRRFVGPYMLKQDDITNRSHFDDTVAFGGWGLDEHCPGGILSPDLPPSFFHKGVSGIYEVPYRCLYSRNIENLSFAGRNASVSHIALSSTRIIGTCCCMGMATGVAAAICVERGVNPSDISAKYIKELQERMLREDYFIPNFTATDANDKARTATFSASSTSRGDVKLLSDGVSREVDDQTLHSWQSVGLGESVELAWDKSVELSSVEIKCDTNLQRPIMMYKNPEKKSAQIEGMPPEMLKSLDVEIRSGKSWKSVATIDDNMRRLIKVTFPAQKVDGVRLKLKDTYGSATVRLYEVRCY